MKEDIFQELKKYSFFAGFEENLLRMIASIVHQLEFSAGDEILSIGETNDNLYFLRSGVVDVLIDGEKVTSLMDPGEVFGEMSAFTGNKISATIRASADVRCFFISSSILNMMQSEEKTKFQSLLYRVYASVLNDRIIKTNQKAKMYEVTARELEKAKKELELVTSAQMSFLRTANQTKSKNVLLLEPDKKQSVTIKSALGGTGVNLHIAATTDEAQQFFQSAKPDLIFCEESSSLEFFTWCQAQNFSGSLILIQSLVFNFELLQKLPFVQNVISRDDEDRA
ncbi:MAG: cyclic nucleotide-binding domain-containing protein, partial [Pseudobdellovibrionaceae bacterium]